MRLTINLATRFYINMRRLNLLIAGAIALLLVLLMANIWNITTDFGAMRRMNDGIAVLEGKASKSAGSAVPEKEFQALLARIKFANGIIGQKAFDWLLLLDKLEGVVPEGIAITAIEPVPKEGGLKLSGMAKSFGNVRKIVENMEDSQYFTDVYLVGQSESQVSLNEKGIVFHITCKARFK